MVRVYRFFGYLLFFIAMLLLFFPKEQLFFAFEKELQNKQLVIVQKQCSETFLSLTLREAEIYFDDMKIADIKESKIMLLTLYNSVDMEDIRLSKMLEKFFPQKITKIELLYTIADPVRVKGSAFGDFGEADIVLNLQERKLVVRLKPSKLMQQHFKSTLKMLKKEADGEYSYEKSL